jgi:hypothetical protein
MECRHARVEEEFASDGQLPAWFISALVEDRKALLRSDAFRSFAFIAIAFGAIYFELWKKVSPLIFYFLLIVMVTLDIAIVDNRYFTKDNYKRKRETAAFPVTEADQEILKDKSYYRVYNINMQEGAFLEARTSYFHHSVGGYHGVKLRRYQDLFDSCLFRQTVGLIQGLQAGSSVKSTSSVAGSMHVSQSSSAKATARRAPLVPARQMVERAAAERAAVERAAVERAAVVPQ